MSQQDNNSVPSPGPGEEPPSASPQPPPVISNCPLVQTAALLDYAARDLPSRPQSRAPVALQFLLGLLTPSFCLWLCLTMLPHKMIELSPVIALAMCVTTVATVGVTGRWPGYIAGALVGLFLAPVAGVIWLAMMCGGIGRL